MKLPGLGRLKHSVREIYRRYSSRALILLYHRVTTLDADPQQLAVTPQHFAEHLAFLHSQTQPMALRDLLPALQNRTLPPRAVVVTFDDGYADNLLQAKPLLERYSVPATVFVATGNIGQACEFLWDELERVLLQPGTLPETLRLTIDDTPHQWKLGDAAHWSAEQYEQVRRWHVLEKIDPSPRQTLYRTLFMLLRPLPYSEQQYLLDELRAWAGLDETGRDTHRPLTEVEIVQLAAGGLVEIGAHTVTHSVLAARRYEVQQSEIRDSKAHLEHIVQQPVTTFSYPFGRYRDYTLHTVSAVRDSGFACACANFPEPVWRRSDPFQLPRMLVNDWDGATFACQVEAWFRA